MKEPVAQESSVFSWVIRLRVPIVAVAAAITVFLALQIPNLVIDPDAEAYVPDGHPIRTYWTEAKEEFGLGRDILVAVESTHSDGVFTPAILAGVEELTERIKFIDGVAVVDTTETSAA